MDSDDRQTILAMLLCLTPWLAVLVLIRAVSELMR